jgi:hypothetical protein
MDVIDANEFAQGEAKRRYLRSKTERTTSQSFEALRKRKPSVFANGSMAIEGCCSVGLGSANRFGAESGCLDGSVESVASMALAIGDKLGPYIGENSGLASDRAHFVTPFRYAQISRRLQA